MVDLKSYGGYFHDGYVKYIFHQGDNVEFWLESAVIIESFTEFDRSIELSVQQSLVGKLHAKKVENILIDDVQVKNLVQTFDYAEIFDLDVFENMISLDIEWYNSFPKKRERLPEEIKVFAKEIYWENIPDLFENIDRYLLEK